MQIKRLVSFILVFSILSALTLVSATDDSKAQSFTDVTVVDYFYNPVYWALESGVTDGTTETTFSPSETCTIGQILTFIWRAKGSEDLSFKFEKNPFMNLSESDYFYNASLFALEHGMVNSRFNPVSPCTRLDAVRFLYLLSGSPSVVQSKVDNLVFKDVSGINKKYVAWALENGITKGKTATTFEPYMTCTRGQIITFLYRLFHINVTESGISSVTKVGFNSFDTNLISYLKEKNEFASSNYMVSPMSLRTALALAVAGANGETKSQLIKAVGFDSEEDLIEWYQSVINIVDTFRIDYESEINMYKQYGDADEYVKARALDIANSVWLNEGKGEFTKDYLDKVKNVYKAEALEASNATITDCVNEWVSNKTHGMISRISDDLRGNDALLVNALYLKTQWYDAFDELLTHEGEFTTVGGKSVKKNFMSATKDFWYYEDMDGSKVLSIPMRGDTYAVFVLGNTDNIMDKLSKVERRQVHVELPKFSFETSFENGELVDFLNRSGAKLAFTNDADFSLMVQGSKWNIGNIIQKTRIKTEESGLEAAAVTAVVMLTTALGEYEEPVEFIANKPFSFYIYTSDQRLSVDNTFAELLFYGEVNK